MKALYPYDINFYLDLAKKYKNTKTWKKVDYKTYCAAQQRGFLKACKKAMSPLWENKWTKENVLKDALKYKYKNDWWKKSPGAVKSSKQNGWYVEAISHMIIRSKRKEAAWTEDELKFYADKYTTRSEWQLNHCASHRAAQRLGLLDKLTANYRKDTSSSKSELDLLAEIRKVYPNANKKRFGRPKKGEFGNYFEIDIFIEELNLGIEFNGNYWHSYEGLKRKFPTWSDERINNYHNIKKSFFEKLDIKYIEVWEKDWKLNKQHILEKINIFLKGEK